MKLCVHIKTKMKSKVQHVEPSVTNKKDKIVSLNNKISESFQQLTKNEKLLRISGAINLLQQLKEVNDDEHEVCAIDRSQVTKTTLSAIQYILQMKKNEFKFLFILIFQAIRARNLRRLVRGLGASTSDSRTGFYSTLVALLSTNSDDYPSVTTIFEVMDAALSIGSGNHIEKVSQSYHSPMKVFTEKKLNLTFRKTQMR